MLIRCYGCTKLFEWEPLAKQDQAPTYHSGSCRTKANKLRSKAKPTLCPRPDKVAYETQQEAQLVANKVGKDNGVPVLNVYRCKCKKIHIGNNSSLIREETN